MGWNPRRVHICATINANFNSCFDSTSDLELHRWYSVTIQWRRRIYLWNLDRRSSPVSRPKYTGPVYEIIQIAFTAVSIQERNLKIHKTRQFWPLTKIDQEFIWHIEIRISKKSVRVLTYGLLQKKCNSLVVFLGVLFRKFGKNRKKFAKCNSPGVSTAHYIKFN